MAEDKKPPPAGPSGGDPRVQAEVKPGKEKRPAHGGAVGTGASTATAPGGAGGR
jgi:hypothetical protein